MTFGKISLLTFLLLQIIFAQGNSDDKKPTSNKSFSVKDLNKMELEKIKNTAINTINIDSLSRYQTKQDTTTKVNISAINNILFLKLKPTLHKIIFFKFNKIAVAKDSTLLVNTTDTSIYYNKQRISNTSTKINTDTTFIIAQHTTLKDSLYISYLNQKSIADSIKNTNKIWLDSLLSQKPASKKMVLYPTDAIEIVLTGGGLYNGINPTISDKITIYKSGLIQRVLKTKLQPETVTEKKISRKEQLKLAQFIIDMGFFEFNNTYDCTEKDYACKSRINSEPYPIPLTLIVSVGGRVKRTYVSLFAPHLESNWVNYPKKLEHIVNAIYDTCQ